MATKVQDRVLPRGCSQTPEEFRATVRRAVAKLDRKDEAQRHAETFAGRHVICYPIDDYMADVVLHLAADGAEIVTTASTAWAVKTGKDDKRTADQRRADAIIDICSHALAVPGLPKRHGLKPSINVTVPFTTLLGLSDGSYTWTSPTRHHYRYRPPELPAPEPEQPYGELVHQDDEPPPF